MTFLKKLKMAVAAILVVEKCPKSKAAFLLMDPTRHINFIKLHSLVKSQMSGNESVTDGKTDRRTDGRTDGPARILSPPPNARRGTITLEQTIT